MTINNDSLDNDDIERLEAIKPSTIKQWLLKGFKNLFVLIKHIIHQGNTLSISAEQSALAQPESYAKMRGRIKMNTIIGYEYLVINILATVIVCCGLATNSVLAIFGASAIAMLLDPVLGASLAIIESDKRLLFQSLFAVIVGVTLVASTAFIFSIFYRYHITNLPESNLMKYATPSLLDLIMAISCGGACAYAALSRKIRVGLGGIMLAITLMPPLAACGIFFAHGSISLAAGSLLSFLTNFIGIQFASSVVFWLHGFKSDISGDFKIIDILKKNIVSVFLILTLAMVLGLNLKHVLDRQRFEQNVKVQIRKSLAHIEGSDLANLTIDRNNVITAVVRSPIEISHEQVKRIAANMPNKYGKHPELHVRVVRFLEVVS